MSDRLLAWFKLDLGEGAFYSVFGLLFVFAGIVLLIAILTLIGLLMRKVVRRREEKQKTPALPAPPAETAEEKIPPQVLAVIAAAVAAYTSEGAAKCDFVVRRIKRL